MNTIRTWTDGPFSLEMRDTGTYDARGCTRIAYTLSHNGVEVFESADFCPSPLHADDSDETVGALLGFLSVRPGDTDAEYVSDYTPEQMEFAEQHGEELGLLALELEENNEQA